MLFNLLGDYISFFFFKEEFVKAQNTVIATESKLPNKVMIFFFSFVCADFAVICLPPDSAMSEEDPPKGPGGVNQSDPVKGTLSSNSIKDTKEADNLAAEINATEAPNKAGDCTRGRGRNRICKHCRFSCTDVREFYHHQRTAHTEGQENEDRSSVTPTTRRSSLRTRRTVSANSTSGNSGETETTLNTSALNGIGSKNATGKTTTDNGTETAGSNSAQKSASAAGAQVLTKTTASSGILAGNSSMISTNSAPTEGDPSLDILHNMSNSFSDDENDLGDEGGRLVIDDSSGTSGSAVTATPTRCGNIQNRTYVCSVCDFTSTSAKSYLRHQRDEHSFDIIIYECDICDYATKYKQKLPRHRKLHFSGTEFALESGQVYIFFSPYFRNFLYNLLNKILFSCSRL